MEFKTKVFIREKLERACESVSDYKKRDCYSELKSFLDSHRNGQVCSLYGLRRTGKTTMMLQAAADLPPDETAYIMVQQGNSTLDLCADIESLQSEGIHYFFIDEITCIDNFIMSASLYSDDYAMQGLTIVLSGTDSLSFSLASQNSLYDRVQLIHTTCVPFKEFSRLLNCNSIDEYLRYGGTLTLGKRLSDGTYSHDESPFGTKKNMTQYVNTAISKNIQHGLQYLERYEPHSYFYSVLGDLYSANEIDTTIMKLLQNDGYLFLSRSVNQQILIDCMTEVLDISTKADSKVDVTPAHIQALYEYLSIIDLVKRFPQRIFDASGNEISSCQHQTLLTQHGLRYCQIYILLEQLLESKALSTLSASEKSAIEKCALDSIADNLLKEVVLSDTVSLLQANQKEYLLPNEVFKFATPQGEFDMVVYDRKAQTYNIFAIKHSAKIAEHGLQYHHIVNDALCSEFERHFGPIDKRIVLYRGEAAKLDNGVIFANVERYLSDLPNTELVRGNTMPESYDINGNNIR